MWTNSARPVLVLGLVLDLVIVIDIGDVEDLYVADVVLDIDVEDDVLNVVEASSSRTSRGSR